MRNNPGGGGGAGGARGAGAAAERVNVRDLGEEEQRAYELLEALRGIHPGGRSAVLAQAGTGEPVGAGGLRRVAALYQSLGMPLHARGIARFKADRGLPTGGGLSTAIVCRAYVRALDGNEILIRVERLEEMNLRPSEKAVLRFLREMQQKRGADTLRPVKELLGLKNPPLPGAAEGLENEYVGVSGVREIAHATTMRELPLTPEGWRRLREALEDEANGGGG